jgi:hypothetical protein
MSTTTITQREAGRLVRAYTARQMMEHLGKSRTLDLVLDGRRTKPGSLSLAELRNLLEAFEEEIGKLEHRAGEDRPAKSKTAPPAPSAEAAR